MVSTGRLLVCRDDGQRAAFEALATILHLHPWLIGQPFRIGYLDEALRRIVRRQGVWAATGTEIIDWYRRERPVSPARP